MQQAGYSHTHMQILVHREWSYNYLNSNHMKNYLEQTLRPIFYVLENFHRKFVNLEAPYRRN